MNNEKLASFLKEVAAWRWDKFVRAELDSNYTTNESIIFGLVRACSMQDLRAIKMSLNRIDGKLANKIKVEYPKVFYTYPNAKIDAPQKVTEALPPAEVVEEKMDLVLEGEVMPTAEEIEKQKAEALPTMGLRQTLREMADYPRDLPPSIIDLALKTEQWIKHDNEPPSEIPMVKSVIAAHLLTMAQSRNIDALTEVFDQIDGKLVDTLQIVGEDIYISIYSEEAPPEAKLNEHGILQIEANNVQDMWAKKLEEYNQK